MLTRAAHARVKVKFVHPHECTHRLLVSGCGNSSEASLSSCNAGIGISFTVFPREEWGKQSTVASDVSPLYSHPAAYLPQSKDCTALFEKQRSVSSLMTWFTLNRSALHPLIRAPARSCFDPVPWTQPLHFSLISHALTPTLIPGVGVFDLDTAWCKNPHTPASSEIYLIDPTGQPHLGGGDWPQELAADLGFIKEMYVRSLTSNAVSLHSAGVLRLHNQNLNMGEKTGRSRRTRLLIIIFLPVLYQPLMILTVQKITPAQSSNSQFFSSFWRWMCISFGGDANLKIVSSLQSL